MNVIADVAPLAILVALLASGRGGPMVACLVAIVACAPALIANVPSGAGAAAANAVAESAWLAAPPIAIVAGGLLFYEAVSREERAVAQAAGHGSGERLFTATFFIGPFAESVTGFGVGVVFAAGALRSAGVVGAPLAAMALIAQALIPWGGLGPGSALGAALADVPAQAIGERDGVMAATWLLTLLPLFWRYAAVANRPVEPSERAGQTGWIAAMGGLLIAANVLLPWEIAGIVATGPLLALRLWRADPPRDRASLARAALAASPYLVLTAALLAIRTATFLPSAKPFAALPTIGLNQPAVAIIGVALIWLAARHDRAAILLRAASRARRPALAILAYVTFARMLVAAGIPSRLASGLAGALGPSAAFASPLLAAASGFFAGSNVGANSMVMPIQASLGKLSGADPVLLPSIQNFCATATMMMSPALVAIACGIAGNGARPAAVWRLGWPIPFIAIAIGGLAVLASHL